MKHLMKGWKMGSSLGLKEQNKLKGNALHGPIKCYELKSIINAIVCRQRPEIKGGSKKSEKIRSL